MAASVFNAVADATVQAVSSLGLQFGAASLPVLKRKLPKIGETLESLPCLIVCPSTPEKAKYLCFGKVKVQYAFQIVMVAAGNRDFAANLGTYLDWREQVRRLLQKKGALTGVAEVFDQDAIPEVVIDRNAVNSNYDYSALGLIVTTAEPG